VVVCELCDVNSRGLDLNRKRLMCACAELFSILVYNSGYSCLNLHDFIIILCTPEKLRDVFVFVENIILNDQTTNQEWRDVYL